MTIKDQNNVIISGTVVIQSVSHRVSNKWVFCNPDLNCKAWNTTESKSKCSVCFPDRCVNGQYQLF